MKEIWPFLLAQWPLSLAFVVTLAAIMFYEWRERQASGQRVDCTELTHLMNHEKALVVDARQASEFAQGHIIGALNITPDTFNDHLVKLRKSNTRPIIVVDSNGSSVGPLLKLLKPEGLTVYFLRGGLTAWRQEGLPLTTVNE